MKQKIENAAGAAAAFFVIMLIGTLVLWLCVHSNTAAWDYVLSCVCTSFFTATVTATAVWVAVLD